MRVNAICKNNSNILRLSFLLVIVLLISCSNQTEQSNIAADTQAELEETAAAKSYPDYAEETAAPAKNYPRHVKKKPAAPAKSYPRYTKEKSAVPATGYPRYAENRPASADNYPEPAGEELDAMDGLYPMSADGAAMKEDTIQNDESQADKFDKYAAILGVDEHMEMPGLPGELRVWIGSPVSNPSFPARMTTGETTVPAVGETAKVEPFAPAFKIEPAESQCIKIHPSGSEVRFKLIPQKSGQFDVGANVYLFDSLDCSGSPIPKTAATLKVIVDVNKKEILVEKTKELWNIFWEQLLKFWAAFVALIFALILFLIKGKLKKWFGFNE